MAASELESEKRKGAINVTAGEIRPLLDVAKAAATPIGPLLIAADLPENFEELDSRAAVPLRAYFRLMQEIGIALEDETMQLSPRQHVPGTMDFVLSHLPSAGPLSEMMKAVAEYYNLLHAGEYNSVRRKGDLVTLVIDDRKFPYRSTDQAYLFFSMECVQIFVQCMLATIAPGTSEAALRGVAVRRTRDQITTDHLSFWGVPVRFGAPFYSLSYEAKAALAPLSPPRASELSASRVYARVDEMIRAREVEPQAVPHASATTRDYLRQGVIEQAGVAERIGISAATLRRRLAEEGTSFRELRQEVLNGAAQSLLRKGRPIADVAEELGFSEFRSFNRAFKEWNGVTPKAFIDQLGRRS